MPKELQPDWLRDLTNGLEGGFAFKVLIDGTNFAIVKEPGRNYRSGQSTQYGGVSYLLVDKRGAWRGGTGITRCSKTLKEGGRITKFTLDVWKTLVDASDSAGTFIMAAPLIVLPDSVSTTLTSPFVAPLPIWFHGTKLHNFKNIMDNGFEAETWFARHMEDAVKFGGPLVFFVRVAFNDTPMGWQACASNVIPASAIVDVVQVSGVVTNEARTGTNS